MDWRVANSHELDFHSYSWYRVAIKSSLSKEQKIVREDVTKGLPLHQIDAYIEEYENLTYCK